MNQINVNSDKEYAVLGIEEYTKLRGSAIPVRDLCLKDFLINIISLKKLFYAVLYIFIFQNNPFIIALQYQVQYV